MKALTPQCTCAGRSIAERSQPGRLPVLLLMLSVLCSSHVLGADKQFILSGIPVGLQEVTGDIAVYYSAMRLNRTLNVWNFEVTITNRSSRILRGPFVLLLDSFTGTPGAVQPDGSDQAGKAFFDVSASVPGSRLDPGAVSSKRTLALGVQSQTPPRVTMKVYAAVPSTAALGLVRSLNEAGQPLPGVQTVVTGPQGQATNRTDPDYALATLGEGAGTNAFLFSAPGYLPVWRSQTLQAGNALSILSPRLTPRDTNSVPVTLIAGGQLSNNAVLVTVPPGAVNSDTSGTLSVLTPQTLPALLPTGWSPLRAFWLEMGVEPSTPINLDLQVWGPLFNGETGALVKWNPGTLQWEVLQLIPGNGGNLIHTTLPGSGAFTLVVPDSGTLGPPPAQVGQALAPSAAPLLDPASLLAGGTVIPRTSPASRVPELVTASAQVIVTNQSGPVPSGLPLRGQFSEQYSFRDGTQRFTPQYDNFILGYQRPGDGRLDTVEATFPIRPLLLFGAEELDRALVQVDVLAPEVYSGAIITTNGGEVGHGDVRVLLGAGVLPTDEAVELQLLNVSNFTGLVSSNLLVRAAFDLSLESLTGGAHAVLRDQSLPANSLFVLARVLSAGGLYGLEPKERLLTDATGKLQTLETNALEKLPGITGAGLFVLAQVDQAQALVAGIANDSSGRPAGGLAVSLAPWLTLSYTPGGQFRLLAPAGSTSLTVMDLATGDTGQTNLTVTDPSQPLAPDVGLSASGPGVVSITPTNNAVGVPRVSSVIVTFSKPINPGTLGLAGVQLLTTNGQPVAASVTLDLKNTTVTLLPLAQLDPSALYTIAIATNITDLAGRLLEGPHTFTFATASDNLNRGLGAQVISYEPTNGAARIEGTQGIADPGVPVILVNETSGRTSTVLSDPDGSFQGTIQAGVDDSLSAVFVNQNGTRNSIPVSRQIFQDGSVGLFQGGGILEAQSDNGPVQLIVEPGTVTTKSKFKFQSVPLGEVLASLSNSPPEFGQILGGFKYSRQGDDLTKTPEIAFPVNIADLGLPPGLDPTNASYALTVPRTNDGVVAYEVVDRLTFENGKLVTHFLPFLGLLTFQDVFLAPLRLSVGQSLTIAGHVLSAQVNFNGTVLTNTQRFLPGALVTAAADTASAGRPGRLTPGALYAAADQNGHFSFLVPVPENSGVILRATHPAFPNLDAYQAVSVPSQLDRFAIGNVLGPVELMFQLPSRPAGDRVKPGLTVSQTPLNPQPGQTAILRVTAIDNASQPDINLGIQSVASLEAGITVTVDDLHWHLDTQEDVGAFGRRNTYSLIASNALHAVLLLSATDGSMNVQTQGYPVEFGGTGVTATNDIPPADPNDRTGPKVIASLPSSGATAFPANAAVVLTFDKPIARSIMTSSSIQIVPAASAPALDLSPDQTVLTLRFPNLQPGTDYTLTLGPEVADFSGNPLDQDAVQSGANPFSLNFHTAPLTTGTLAGVDSGGGAVLRGIYAYVLDRAGPLDGSVDVYDLSSPSIPVKVAQFGVPGYPRDLALIPSYSFKRAPDGPVETKDLLAVAGGKLNGSVGQYLWIIDISDPRAPQRVAAAQIDLSPSAAVTKVVWSAPRLGYLDIGDTPYIGLINLQSFILGELVRQLQPGTGVPWPIQGSAGVDLNGDGDYVDAGEQLPLPQIKAGVLAGFDFAFTLNDTDQFITDFALGRGGDFIGVTLEGGHTLGSDGLPTTNSVPAAYRTLYDPPLALTRETASYTITNGSATRVSTLLGFPLRMGSQVSVLDLALVSVIGQDGGSNRLLVLDVTDPTAPHELTSVPVPAINGSAVYSLSQRDDGLLLLACSQNILLLDPSRFGAAGNDRQTALIGVIPNAGMGARSFTASQSGLEVTSLGSRNLVTQSAPSLQIVSLPGVTPFTPSTLQSTNNAALQTLLDALVESQFLAPARFRSEPGIVNSTLSPPDPAVHYYVLVHAPGSAGPSIELALESLNWTGHPLRSLGFLFPPVHALGAQALQAMGQNPSPEDAPTRSCTAWRLSNNPASDFYNVYLSRSFALVYEEMSPEDLEALQSELDREILWSGSFVRACIAPSMAANPVLGAFAGTVSASDGLVHPGVEAITAAFPGDYLQSPNPGPVAGAMLARSALNALGTYNSELILNAIDLELPGRRLPIQFRRNYSSQGLFNGPFGRGWDFNYNQRVLELKEAAFGPGQKLPLVVREPAADSEIGAGGDLLFYTGAGRVLVYKDAGTNAPPEISSDPLVQNLGWIPKTQHFYLPPDGAFNLFFKFKDGHYARLETDGTQYWYNSAGRLLKIYDRYEGNALELGYNARGEVIRINDELGRAVDIGYWRLPDDPLKRTALDETTSNPVIAGNICRLRDYSDRDVLFYYTDDGLLERREGPGVETGTPASFHGRQVTRYNYSDASQPGRSAKSLIGVVGGDDTGSALLSATALGRQGRDTVDSLRVGPAELQISQNFSNTARALSLGNAMTSLTSQDGAVTENLLDRMGRVTQIACRGTNGPALTNRCEYYPNGLLKSVTAPEGNQTEFVYDSSNACVRARGNVIRVTRHPRPGLGTNLIATTKYDLWYNLPAGPKTDFNGNTATITLTADHRDTASVTLSGEIESFTVNSFGQAESSVSYDGIERRWTYNADGFLSSSSVGPLTTTYLYNPSGTSVSDPSLRGLPSAVIDPNGVRTDLLYDERGRMVRMDRAGLEVTQSYDAQGNMTETTTGVETGRMQIRDRSFNQFGLLTNEVVRQVETGGATRDLVTTFIPDVFNRIKEVIFPGGDHHVLQYDHAGRVTQYRVDNAYTETYTYDGNGNQISRSNGAGTDFFFYDGQDRLDHVVSAEGTRVDLSYDGNGNVLAQTVRAADGTNILSQTTYTVDALNRCRSVNALRDQGVSTLTYDYNSALRTIVITDALGASVTNAFDTAGRLAQVAGPTSLQNFTYDGAKNLIRKESIENGVSYLGHYSYDALNHLTNVTDNAGNASTLIVGLDGRILARVDKEGHVEGTLYSILGEPLAITNRNQAVTAYAYNANRQLTAVADPAGNSLSNFYDAPGRLLTTVLPDGAQTVQTNFNALNLPELTELPREIGSLAVYDAEGNLTNRTVSGPGGSELEICKYDGLRRPIEIDDAHSRLSYQYDRFGFIKEAGFTYRFLSNPPPVTDLVFTIGQETDAGGFRSELIYPEGALIITNRRDTTGRLLALFPTTSEPVVQQTVYAADDLIGSRILGNDRLRLECAYDPLKRCVSRRYVRVSDSARLAETRYVYDRNGAQQARQYIHRAGRVDFFSYDPGYRLARADLNCRPALAQSEPARSFPGFQIPSRVTGTWSAGMYARAMSYSSADVLQSRNLINPDNVPAPVLGSAYGSADELLFVSQIDGFARTRDAAGNVTRDQLAVRLPSSPAPVLVGANLSYNNLGQLTRVERDDGVVVLNEYDASGLRIRRRVSGDPSRCAPSDLAFLYDSGRLIEERDLNQAGAVVARFYYGDEGDELLAGDVAVNGDTNLSRIYFLTDTLKSVLAVADGNGQVLERTAYQPWGFPTIEAADHAAPRVSRIWQETNSLLIEFTERVLPAFAGQLDSSNLLDTLRDPGDCFTVQSGSLPVSGAVVYEENYAGAPFGTVFRFTPQQALAGQVQLTVNPGTIQDEWNNTNTQEVMLLDLASGNPLYSGPGPGSTAPVELADSSVGSPFFFEGQFYDDASGLYYCRARFYSPWIGMFLTRDPRAYQDGPNQYAGFANNPANLRDPSGAATDELGRTLSEFGSYLNENSRLGYWSGLGSAFELVGSTLQLGTATAEGVDLLKSDRQGTLGLLDRIHGAELVAKDVQTAVTAGTLMYSAGRAIAGKIQGYRQAAVQKREALQRQKALARVDAIRKLSAEFGTTEIEAAALLDGADETGITAYLRYDEVKRQARALRVEEGLLQKPAGFWNYKTSSHPQDLAVGSVPTWVEDWSGPVPSRELKIIHFAPDIDALAFEKNGRLVTAAESTRYRSLVNSGVRNRAEMFGVDHDVPFKHPSQLEAAYDSFGGTSAGHELNRFSLKQFPTPDAVVTIRPYQPGVGYLIERTPEQRIGELLDRATPRYQELQRKAGIPFPEDLRQTWRYNK